MSLESLLSRWRADPQVAGNVSTWEILPAVAARLEKIPDDLHPILRQSLERLGIVALYSHQVEALQAVWDGRHAVIITSTASGKTLSYNLPVLDSLLRDSQVRALYLFPTKALAQDQLNAVQILIDKQPDGPDQLLHAAIYDGDTTAFHRPAIRKNARLVLSNPDMLHTGILPHHTAWADFFQGLRYVVIDEMHIYRGVFGSHVANVMRRLRRVARFYGASPQFLLTSATIANPLELAGRLVEPRVGTSRMSTSRMNKSGSESDEYIADEYIRAEIALIEQDGAAHGPKHFLIYNPPVVDAELGIRRSAVQESVRLAEDLFDYDIQTILFGRTRRTVELLLTYLRESVSQASERSAAKNFRADVLIRGYRSGYLPQQRREIEQGLRQGTVRVVAATTALELGIDIGALGAAILVGYPGSIAATWQQAGRAGRGSDASLAILVATADPLDQFLAAHPDYFFGRTPEQALINPDNILLLLAHIRCAAFELPFQRGERFGSLEPERLEEFLDFLVNDGLLHMSGDRYFWMADQYPAQAVSLRSVSVDNILLQVSEVPFREEEKPFIIGEVDRQSALWMVHPNAIYLHEGQTYLVNALDLEGNIAHLIRSDADYYTEPRSETTVNLLENLAEQPVLGGTKTYGEIIVTNQIIGYKKIQWHTRQQLGLGELELPSTELQTTAYWLTLSETTVACLQELGLWSNAPNQYGPGWPRQRDRARARDGYRCQVCGVLETDRAHDVHHRTPFRRFASAEAANQLGNLVTLCPACHRRAETAVRVRSGLAGLGFVLGHLAPLFLMCDSRDLGVYSDPQSPLSGGQPTVFLYDQTPAGIGLSQRLFEVHSDLTVSARELVAKCACQDGCPSCVGPGGELGLGSKRETLAILDALASSTSPC